MKTYGVRHGLWGLWEAEERREKKKGVGFGVVIIFDILVCVFFYFSGCVCVFFFRMCVFFLFVFLYPEVSQRKYTDIGEICLKKLGARVAHLYFNIF